MMRFVVRHTGTFIDLAIGTRCDAVDLVWYSTYSCTATALKAGSGGTLCLVVAGVICIQSVSV